jgi:hypothetical protein
MTKKLFGGSSDKSVQKSGSGFGALPTDIQERFRSVADIGAGLLESPEQYFAPQDLSEYEQTAGQMVLPENFGVGIANYLNPFRDIITQDINRAFEDPYSALKSRANEAGAFGSSRYREGEADLERARLDAITSALSGQFNQAGNQYQQGIQNLLGFGGLERAIDLAQRQALPTALGAYSQLINPLLGASFGTQFSKGSEERGITQGFKDMFSSSGGGGGGGGMPMPVPA